MQLLVWRHFQIQVPDDWEMLLYSKEVQSGRCTFADRYQHRLEFNWSKVPSTPDFERMISDYIAELRQDDSVEHVEPARYGEWHGFVLKTSELLTSRFGTYLPAERCLVELVFLWPEQRDTLLERRVLDNIREERKTPQGFWRWRAFGMDALVSDGLVMQSSLVQPANARMVFAPERGLSREERFERKGMVQRWLTSSVRDWLRKQVPKEVRVRQQLSEVIDGHEVEQIIGDSPVIGFGRLIGRRVAYRSWAWICPTDGRLYCQVCTGDPSATRRLSCCGRMKTAS